MLELLIDQPIFIGFKVDNALRQQIESLSGVVVHRFYRVVGSREILYILIR